MVQFPTTPVKAPIAVKVADAEEEAVIRRPSLDKQRRISAPIKDKPETRVAPEQILGAPKADRCRRPSEDRLIFTPTTTPPKPQDKLQTPRRRSSQLTTTEKTPEAAPPKRLCPDTSFGSLAPLRTQRADIRILVKNPDIEKRPLF